MVMRNAVANLGPSARPCKARQNLTKAVKTGFEILDDFHREFVRFGQVVEIGEALVPEPENRWD
jgi:hypothetical protein